MRSASAPSKPGHTSRRSSASGGKDAINREQKWDDTPPKLALDEPGLAACYAAAAQGLSLGGDRVGQPPLRLIASPDPPARPRAAEATDQPIAEVRGINIHAVQVVDGRDRRRAERLCKYITRPPVAQDRPASPRLASLAGPLQCDQARLV